MTKIDGKDFVESLYLEADLDCSTIDNYDGSVNFGNVRERNGRNYGGGNSAYKPEIGTQVRLFKPNTLYGAYCLAIMQESTNKLSRQSCSKNVDLNSVGLDVDSSVSDVSVTANNLDVSIVTNSDLTKPNEDFRKEIKDDVVIESNDENKVIDNTGLMGFAEANNENVNGKRMELRVYERNVCENSVSICSPYTNKKKAREENTRNDISLMEMTTIFEKRKGTEVKKIRKRHGFGAMDYGDSLFPILGLDGGADGTKLLTLNQIMQALIQNFNMMTINFDRTTIGYQNFTCGRESDKKMGDLSDSSLIVNLDVAKINEGSLGHLKFDVWKWPKKRRKGAKCKVKKRGWKFDFWKWLKSKNAGRMYCLAKNREWKFDIWRWPKRKKRGIKCGSMHWNNFVINLNKINDLKNKLYMIQMMKARLEKEVATLSTFQPQPFMAMVFLKDGLKFLEEEKGSIMKGMQTMKTPIAYVDMAQDKKDAQEVGVRGRCFASSSNHKNNCYGISAHAEGSRVRGNSPRNSSLYTRHLHLVKSGLVQQQRMMARKRERANGKSARGKGRVLEDCFSGYSYS
nr:hypothetical protein [Tanacetum cinerariifolium]